MSYNLDKPVERLPPCSTAVTSGADNTDQLTQALDWEGNNQLNTVTYCGWKDIALSTMTNSSTGQTKPLRFHERSVDGRQGASFQLRKSECGSSAQSCQANVIQTVRRAEVAVGNREIPHCITTLLSKLYYLGHSLLYGCQSYHTKNWNSPYLVLPEPTHKHTDTYKRLNAANTTSISTNNEL